MATPRKSPFEKALARALKVEVALLLDQGDDSTRRLKRADEAWRRVAELHGPCPGPGLCEWCDLHPDPLG